MNTIGTGTYSSVYRAKYATKLLQLQLRSALVAEKVCAVDNSDVKYIHSPLVTTTQGAVVDTSGVTGSYSTSAWSTADDSLTVSDQVSCSVHLYDHERVLHEMDMFTSFVTELNATVACAIDKWVVNNLCEDGTGTYDTPSGGFTTAANIPVIFSNLIAKVAGYSDMYKGMFIILENSDLTGLIQTQVASGFSYADAALNNGFVGNYLGVDIYVVRDSTYVDDSAGASGYSGTKTWTNSGHRVFGIKGVTTYCAPRGIQYEEKSVTQKTGREIVVWGYVGFKAWTKKAGLIIDITIK